MHYIPSSYPFPSYGFTAMSWAGIAHHLLMLSCSSSTFFYITFVWTSFSTIVLSLTMHISSILWIFYKTYDCFMSYFVFLFFVFLSSLERILLSYHLSLVDPCVRPFARFTRLYSFRLLSTHQCASFLSLCTSHSRIWSRTFKQQSYVLESFSCKSQLTYSQGSKRCMCLRFCLV